jgi:hypothetical protein
MAYTVIVWGTGNVGRPAVRAVLAHPQLDLVGVIVSDPDKVGKDAGELVGLPATGIVASDDAAAVLVLGADAVVYTATGDIRPQEAMADLLACLNSGHSVVSTSFYSFLYPAIAAPELLQAVEQACAAGNSSLFVSGIDPGWAMDVLPLMLTGMVSDIREIRCQEIFNYALYDQPQVVREVIGFGQPMADLPMMLHDFALRMVWEPMVRLLGDGMGVPVETMQTRVERRPLEETIQVDGMGQFDAGTQGAFRFEVQGLVADEVRYVVEHITRIDDSCAPDWPYPPQGRGCHQIKISGSPDLMVSLHASDSFEPGAAGGGNATAACRIVNALPAVIETPQGVVTALDLPLILGNLTTPAPRA